MFRRSDAGRLGAFIALRRYLKQSGAGRSRVPSRQIRGSPRRNLSSHVVPVGTVQIILVGRGRQ
jgi:hypothetical protein